MLPLTPSKQKRQEIEASGSRLRLINSHPSPFDTDVAQNEELRLEQAKVICQQASEGEWDGLVLGMDMNDLPSSSVHKIFTDCGFRDAYDSHKYVFEIGDLYYVMYS